MKCSICGKDAGDIEAVFLVCEECFKKSPNTDWSAVYWKHYHKEEKIYSSNV